MKFKYVILVNDEIIGECDKDDSDRRHEVLKQYLTQNGITDQPKIEFRLERA